MIRRQLKNIFLYILSKCNKKYLVSIIYSKRKGKKMNWQNPQDLDEKINWLKVYGDTSQWPTLADKYKVREYIKNKGLEGILVPLYGVWSKVDDIDFDILPESFVIKTNHGSGDCIVVRDKKSLNIEETKKILKDSLRHNYGVNHAEFHYSEIPPRIIAEQLLIQDCDFSSTLIDYKVWCFNGEPYMIWVCYNRGKKKVMVECHDLNWNYHPEWSIFYEKYQNGKGIVPKPKHLPQMIEYARALSHGFPQVRVDFYVVKDKIYFGEMTFTSNGGYNHFFTPDFQLTMGRQITLPKVVLKR